MRLRYHKKRALLVSISTTCALLPMTPAYAQSMEQARASVAWLTSADCPQNGAPLELKSLATPAQRNAARSKNMSIASTGANQLKSAISQRATAVQQIQAYGNKPSRRLRADLENLDSAINAKVANVSLALVQWTQAQWIDMALINPVYPYTDSNPHPLAPFVSSGSKLKQVVGQYGGTPAANELLSPIAEKFQTCLISTQNDIFKTNALLVKATAADSTSIREIEGMISKYAVANRSFKAPGIAEPSAMADIKARLAFLKDEEAQRIAARRAKEAAERAERERLAAIEREKQCNAGKAAAQNNLALAKTFVAGVNAKSINKAASVLHPDVVISSPSRQGGRNTYRGKVRARERLQEGFSSNDGGSTKTPYISGCGNVSATMLTSNGRARMEFSFKEGMISRLYIVN